MSEAEYKEKVERDDDQMKVERKAKDEFGNEIKEKHKVEMS